MGRGKDKPPTSDYTEPDESTVLVKPSANVLAFESLEFEVETNINSTTVHQSILQGVSGSARSGEPLCVLGPSGAGKTTFLKVITLAADEGAVSGQVTLNGHLMDAAIRSKHCCMVGQDETTWSHLSCWESLWFAAGLYVVGDEQTKLERCNHCMQKMGLESCKDVMVGDQFRTGLSGGERKRLLVAMALLKNPSVLFLDEPTSGLDAAAAAHTMEYMLGLARSEQLILVATIHQPSSCTFSSFGDILLLSQGRVAYHGQACDAVEYFEKLGYVAPAQLSTPEWLLELVNPEYGSVHIRPEHLLVVPSAPLLQEQYTIQGSSSNTQANFQGSDSQASRQMCVLLWRLSLLAWRDLRYAWRFGVAFITNCFILVVFWDCHKLDNESAEYQPTICILPLAVMGLTCQLGTMVYSTDFKILKHEMSNGMVTACPGLLAYGLLISGAMAVATLICLFPFYIAYESWRWETFPSAFLLGWYALLYCEGLSVLCAILCRNPLCATVMYSVIFFVQYFCSSMLVSWDNLYSPLRGLLFISPFSWYLPCLICPMNHFAIFLMPPCFYVDSHACFL